MSVRQRRGSGAWYCDFTWAPWPRIREDFGYGPAAEAAARAHELASKALHTQGKPYEKPKTGRVVVSKVRERRTAKYMYPHGKGFAAKVKLGPTRYYRGRFATEAEAEAWVLQARAAHKLGHPIPVEGGGPRTMTAVGPVSVFTHGEAANPFFSVSGRFFAALSRLKSLHGEMTVLQAICLFYIAQNKQVSQQSLCQDVGIKSGVATRTVTVLARPGRGRLPSLCLVEVIEDPKDHRHHLLSLTPRGRRLLEEILRDFDRDWLTVSEAGIL
jgi:DNA-binding MarR family transcriptional regulator